MIIGNPVKMSDERDIARQVVIPQGYTERFIEGEITYQEHLNKVLDSHDQVNKVIDIVLLEGT